MVAGARDFDRHVAKNTPYADWALGSSSRAKRIRPVCHRLEPQEDGIQRSGISVTTPVDVVGGLSIDLPLEPRILNEHLFDIGLWLMEREIPHQVRISMEPKHRRIRVSLSNAKDAMAFSDRFVMRV